MDIFGRPYANFFSKFKLKLIDIDGNEYIGKEMILAEMAAEHNLDVNTLREQIIVDLEALQKFPSWDVAMKLLMPTHDKGTKRLGLFNVMNIVAVEVITY